MSMNLNKQIVSTKICFGMIILSFLLAFTSCEKRLDVTPLSNLTDATYYNTEEDAKAALGACYANISNPDVFIDLAMADDAVPFLTGDANRPLLWRYDITPDNGYIRFYPGAYNNINRCNIVINLIPNIEMDEGLKQRYVAEAKFLRALAYFNLVRLYGGVPIVTTATEGAEGLEAPRATVEEVYTLIESDLQEAEQILPESYDATDRGRVTKGATRGLLAKVYLTRAGADQGSSYWAQAAVKAEEVINGGVYNLYPTFAEAFALSARGGIENIFEIQHITDVRGHSLGRGYGVRAAPIYPGTGAGIARVTANLFNLYADDDQRKAVTFLTSYTYQGNTVELSVTDPNPANAVSFQKLWDRTATTNGGEGTSIPILRFADVLLIYAEALNEASGGPTAEAYEAINRVRFRAGLNPLANLDYQSFKEAVLLERRLELTFENNRFFDLLRTDKLVETIRADNSFNRNAQIQVHHVLLPIPQLDMDVNPLLEQNPGY
ncbi:RagB/SusD family nutrient uptake outer membrane protein [Olivibacter sp. SDN3]|uniref:RagB/SusD family nutrient uptake outer membrane protein n=1 Tax=Olivibacter sp. SDN3 TaxID=2764720 RepID=UPI0016515311|nr:RagB/SusD family nutrient uptake outer membrane protein [Olivibacter sp. SDN3]QNL48381.1 RagB/SusD family nutrient uptake outer membrane protein [Olivibacter sp. SDN3]